MNPQNVIIVCLANIVVYGAFFFTNYKKRLYVNSIQSHNETRTSIIHALHFIVAVGTGNNWFFNTGTQTPKAIYKQMITSAAHRDRE